jgi:hypothetical protein
LTEEPRARLATAMEPLAPVDLILKRNAICALKLGRGA